MTETTKRGGEAAVLPLARGGAPAARAGAAVWAELSAGYEALKERRVEALFAADPNRFETFSATFDDLLLDYSKEKIDRASRAKLFELAEAADLAGWREKLFAGERVNNTERRAARHDILRADAPPHGGVVAMREQFLDFAEETRAGTRVGVGGAPFTDVVNIGIGGSYLGPRLVVEALAPIADGPRVHFVSNVDPWNFRRVVERLDPSRTLILCASKSFRTQETAINLRQATEWLVAHVGPRAIEHQVCAITARPDKAREAGVASERIFQMWDWAGGRFSVWSSIGLCAALAVGRRAFEAFLAGGADMDEHFRAAPIAENLPALLALIGVWRRNVQGYPAYVISPYEERLGFFPDYVQQLEMESNGKGCGRDGAPLKRLAAPFVFGGAGTNTQHSFFQKLHQGADAAPVDFFVGVETATRELHAQRVLVAHCLAQGRALMGGRSEAAAKAALAAKGAADAETVAPHLACPGDRPSTTLMYKSLDPTTLGRLIALYEHKIFAQSVLWGLNCFDQWGVELGKELAGDLLPRLDEPEAWDALDPSTQGLLAWRRALLDEDAEV